jgi:hypothetical protein
MPKLRIATKRTLTDLHKEIGAILREADRLNAKPGQHASSFAIATAIHAVQNALASWERIQDQGLKGPEKRQALADINESLERRRAELRRFFGRIGSPPLAPLSDK